MVQYSLHDLKYFQEIIKLSMKPGTRKKTQQPVSQHCENIITKNISKQKENIRQVIYEVYCVILSSISFYFVSLL